MKTVMRSLPFFLLMLTGIIVSGCYTEFATSEYVDDEYYADTDTAYDEEGYVTINNNYYLDDDYRRSRFRLSFNYYYPSYHSSWIAGYYHSFYDDPYWGWHRPLWYHHYPHYTIIYPNPWWPPIYDPWYPYPYYPVTAYYPPYYNPPVYGYNPPANPGRVRTDGSTRDPRDPGARTRPLPNPTTPGTTVATGGTSVRTRTPEVKTAPVDDRKRDDIPWWKKMENTSPEKRQRVADGRENSTPRNDRTVSSPPRKNVQRDDRPEYRPPSKNKPRDDRKVDEGTKNKKPAYNPPKRSVPQDDAKPAPRSRESGRSYSPPSTRQAPPQSSPPRSSGGSSGGSSSSGGRKRAD